MKHIQNHNRSYWVAVAVSIIILGFTPSCIFNALEGAPFAKFIVEGTVTNQSDQQIIPGIRVILNEDTVFTCVKGQYWIATTEGSPDDRSFAIKFEDIDGAQNGRFSNLDTVVQFKDPEFTGGDGDSYVGETKTSMDIILSPK